MLAILNQLSKPQEFWPTISVWVFAGHVRRRRRYYEARFVRERLPEDLHLFYLVNEFYSDAACQTEAIRRTIPLPPMTECPFSSCVEFDEFLERIQRFSDWPKAELHTSIDDHYDSILEWISIGFINRRTALEDLKRYARSSLSSTHHPPILPLT